MPIANELAMYTGSINIGSHSLFCWQNQDLFDLQFSIGAGERAKYELALTKLIDTL